MPSKLPLLRREMVALVAAICLSFAATVLTAQSTWAAEIVVNTTTDEINNNGLCSLREAVVSANADSNTNAPDCVAGTGADTIVLAASTYTLTRTSGPIDIRDLSVTDTDALTITGVSAISTTIVVNMSSSTTSRGVGLANNAVLTLQNLAITGGDVNGNGGAISTGSGSRLTLRNVLIEDNDANDNGGGISNSGALTVINSTLQDNSASDNGGGIYNSGTLTVTGSLFTGNDADDRGGGLSNTNRATITNTTFSANAVTNGSSTRGGGGISNEGSGSQLTAAYVTLFENQAPTSATGANIGSFGGSVSLTASIVNLVDVSGQAGSCETSGSGAINSSGYNIDSGNTCAFSGTGDQANTDPLLGALVNAGGSTNVHPLQANSPAIDVVASGSASCGTTVTADQRGQPRPQDGNADTTAACDVGAYELAGQTSGGGTLQPVDVTVLTTVIDSGNGPLSTPTQPLGPDPVNAGEAYRFFVEIENLDLVNAASGVSVHDTLLGLSGAVVSDLIPAAGWSCSFGGAQLLCSYTGELLGNGSPTAVAEVALTLDADQPSGTITHYLQASTLNPDVDLSNNACDLNAATVSTTDDCVTFSVQGQADLSISKRALTPSAAPGGFLLYEIEVINNGPSRLASAVVTDTVSSGPGTIVSASPNCAVGAATTCTVTDLEVGERRSLLVTVQVASNATVGATVTNCADVADVPGGAQQSCDSATVAAPSLAADLEVVSVNLSTAPLTPGADEALTFQVRNNSAVDAQGVVVHFSCPALGNLSLTNFTVPQIASQDQWAYTAAGTFTRLAALPANAVEDISFTLRAPSNAHYTAAGLIDTCTATIAAINPDPALANNRNSANFASQAQADLSLTKTLLTPNVAAAGLAIYALNVCNAGPSDVAGVAVVDTLGANLVPGSAVASVDLANLYLRAGECENMLVTAQVNESAAPNATFSNSAAVDAASVAQGDTTLAVQVNEPTSGAVDGQVAAALAAADIRATGTITDLTAPIVAGQSYQFQIGIENAGPAQAQGVSVHDVLQGLPVGWTVSAIQTDPNWVCSSGLSCTRSGAMPVQAETVATVTVQIPAQTLPGTYSHQLGAAANNPDGDLSNNETEYTFAVETATTLGIEIGNVDEPLVAGGDGVLYTVTVLNTGPSRASFVEVSVAVPADLILVSLNAVDYVACSRDINTGTGSCIIPSIPAEGAVTFYATLRARAAAATGPINALDVAVTAVGNTTANLPTAQGQTRIDAVADLSVIKNGPLSVTVGSNAVYTVTVANNGPSDAAGVRITDTLPAQMTFVSASGATCSASGSTVTCAPFDLAAGASRQVVITAALSTAVCFAGNATNRVVVSPDRYVTDSGGPILTLPQPDAANNQAQWTHEILSAANLSVVPTVLNSPVNAGGVVDFQIQITNSGPGCAPDVFLIDELNGNFNPDGLEQVEYYAFQSTQGDSQGLLSGWYYVCTSGICRRAQPMPAGTTDTIRILARVPADTPVGDYDNWVNVFTTETPAPGDTPVEDGFATWTVSAAANLSIAKTLLTPGTVAAGGLLQYEISVFNAGPSVASGINVTDTLTAGFPAGTQIVAASPECSGAPATSITCAVNGLWPGQSRDFLVTVRVSPSAANGATIQNCAVVNDLPGGVNPTACAATATVGNTLGSADVEMLSLSCTAILPGSTDSNDITECTAFFQNVGPAQATGVVLAQRLVNVLAQGQSLTFDTSQSGVNPVTLWNCSTGTTCTRTAPMPAGAIDTITLRFRTLPDAHLNAISSQTIRSEFLVSALNPDAAPFNNRLIVSPLVQPRADLRVEKTALTQNPAPGSTVLFAVTVYNDGFSDVDGIGIDDVITTGNATILSVTPASTVYIAAGTSQQFLVLAQIDDAALPGDVVTNQVTINTLDVDDGLSQLATATGYNGTINDVITDTASVTVAGSLPDADISVTNTITNLTSPIVAGGLYSFSIGVSNLGPAQAQGVTVHDLLVDLPGAQIVDVTPAANWLCSGALTCTRQGAFLPQISETVATVTMTIPANTPAGVYRHRLAASTDNPDPVLANNSSEIYTFTVTTAAALSINVDDLNTVLTAGDAPGIYPIQVLNSGPSDAADVDVSVSLPTGFTLVALAEGDQPMFCDLGAATCTIPAIAAGTSRTIYAAIAAAASTLPAAQTLVVEVCIADTQTCDSESSDVVARADLVLDKRATATVNAGETITYTVDVFNAGPSDAQNVQVTDTLPAGVTVESADICTQNAGVITCPATTLAVGASQSYRFIVRTNPAAQPGTSLENVAAVTSSTADLNTLNNRDDADTSVVSLAALSLTKNATAATVNAGESVSFDIVVSNAGPSTAQNVTVEDALPAGLSLLEAVLDLGSGPQPCGGVLCSVGNLGAGQSATVRISALAAADLAVGTVLTNTAQVSSASAEANLADNRATAIVSVTTQAQITLTKEDLLDPVVLNDLADVDDLAYVLTVANRGPSAASSLRVTDTLPAGVVGQAFVLGASWSPGPQPATCSGAGEIVCDLGAIPAGEQVQIYVRADVQDSLLCGSEITNQATAGWLDSRGSFAVAPVTATTAILCQSDIDIDKSGPASVAVGEVATYVITVTNTGPSALNPGQLTLSDLTPAGLTFVQIAAQSGSCGFSGAAPWTNSGALAVGSSCSLSVEYTVTAAACPVGVLFNRATVSTLTGDSDQALAVTTLDCNTTLAISLFPDFFPEDLVAGNIVDFEVTVENTGNVTAFDVELTDNIYFPQFGARIVDLYLVGSFAGGECTNNGFCNLGDLAVGESVTAVASVEIDSNQAILGEVLVKDACAEADNATSVCLSDFSGAFEAEILSDVELAITKQTLYDPIVVSGGSVRADGYYVLEVLNLGLSDAFGIVISDTLPVGMVVSDEPVVTASYSFGAFGVDCSGSVDTNTLLCFQGTPLPAGETLQIVVPVGFEPSTAADFCAAPNNSFTNVAEVLWFDDIDGEQNFISNEATSNFVCRGDVDVIKSGPATVTYAEAAAGFAYTVTVQNTGPSPIVAGGLTVTDTLPAGLFFDASATVDSGACGLVTAAQTGDSVIVFSNASPLAAGESCTVTFGVTTAPNGQTPASSLYSAGDLFNVATVAAGNDLAQAVWLTQIDFSTQLTVTKQALGPVVAGQAAVFEIVITNTGDAPAFNLLLTDNANARGPIDPLGAQVTAMSIVGQPAGQCSDSGVCQIAQLQPQESVTVLATVLVDASSLSSEVRQQACVATGNAAETCAVVSAEVERINDVRIRKDDLGNVLIAGGAPVQYIITVWNEDGPSTAFDVVVRDDMLPGFTLVGDLEPGSQRIDCPDVPGAGDNVCIIRALRPGDSVELYATVAANADAFAAAETPVNQACIVEIDGVALADPLCDTESTNVSTAADLALVKNAPATVGAGDRITYTIDVSNLGPSVAQNVTVTDVLPAALTLVGVDASLGGCSSLPCALGTMPVGSSAVITVIATVDSAALVGSSIENVATVSTSTPDPNPSNNSDDADSSVVTVADLRITKQTAVTTATAGLPITYTITVVNAGPGQARNVEVHDALSAGMTLIQATVTPPLGDPFLCAGTICAVGDLSAGQSATIELIARVDADFTGASVTNRATVSSLAYDPNPTDNDSGPVTTPVTTLADVSVEKRALANPVDALESFLYEIVVRNAGPSAAQAVTLVDTLDANVTFLGASNGWVHDGSATGGTVQHVLGTLPAGGYASYVVAVRANEVMSGTQLINTVVANSVTADPVENNSATATVTVENLISSSVALSLSKTAAASSVVAGQTITYSLVVSNAGPLAATNVLLVDLIPFGTQVVTMTANNAAVDGEFCGLGGVCNLGKIEANASAAVTLVLAVDAGFDGDSLTNQAQVAADQAEANMADNVASATVAVTRSADLTIAKADLNDPVLAGETILYQITLANNGPSDAEDVTIEDTLPPGTTFAGTSAACFDNVLEVICRLGDVAAGERVSVFIELRTDSALPSGTLIFNTARVSSPTDPTDANASAMTTVNRSPLAASDLILSKQADPGPVVAGATIRYTLTVTNAGPTQATNVLVVDALPSGLTVVSAQASQGICNSGVTCMLGDLPVNGTATVTIVAQVTSSAAGVLENRARVAASNPDLDSTNNQAAVTTAVTQQADLSISKRGLPEPVTPGQRLTYEIVVNNAGPSDAAGVTVDDLLPAGFTLTTVRSSQAGCSVLPCTLGTIAAGASASVTLVGTVDAAVVDALDNTATATAQTVLVNTADDTVTISTPVSPLADVYVQKIATPTVNAGDEIDYTITVVNQGPSDAQDVTVIDTLPAGVTVTDIGGCALNGSTLTCAIGTLAAGKSAQINLSTATANTLTPGTRLENRVTLTTGTSDRTQADNVAVAATNIIGAADLSLSKSGPATATAGTEIEYTIVVTNSGPSAARGVDVKDALPSGTTLIEATIQRSGSGPQLCGGAVCQLGEMAVGETAVVTVRALVGESLSNGSVLTNTATIFSASEDANPANNSDSAVTVVSNLADIAVTVLDLSDPVQPTGGFVYDIALTNNGPSMARGVVLTDVLDINVTFSSISPACVFNGEVLCNVGNLAVGETVRFLLAVTAADVANGTLLLNTVTATTTTPDPQPANNTDSEETTVQLGFGPSADLSVSKEASLPVVNAGEWITYTMVVSNAGPVEATDVKLIEVIPAGTRLVGIKVSNPSFASATCALSGLCLLGKVPVGANAMVTATLLVEKNYADIVVNNLVTVLADQIDPRPRNNIDMAVVEVIPFVPLPSVQIEKTLNRVGEAVDGIVPVGERISFTIKIANSGELQIVDMPLIDTYDPTKLAFVSASPAPSNSSLGVILWNNLLPGEASLAVGDAFEVTVVFEAIGSSTTSVGVLTENVALVNAAEGQNGQTAPAVSATASVQVTAPSMESRKAVDTSTPSVILPGDLITYSITVSNTGDTRLVTIPVEDLFDADHLTFVTAQIAPTTTASEKITWADVGDLEVGGALTFTVTFRVSGDVPFVENLALPGAVIDENGDPAAIAGGLAPVSVGIARLAFELDSLPAPNTEIRPGDVVTYYLHLINRGGISLTEVKLVTEVPEGTTLIGFAEVPPLRSDPAVTPAAVTPVSPDGQVYEWSFGTMAAASDFETLMVVRVNPDTTLQAISMDAAYSSRETAAGQSNELLHPLSPTAITLEYFTATQVGNGVLVRWKTAAEVNTWGFYVVRGVAGRSERVRINPTLIPATGAGSVYEYLDTNAAPDTVYEYWLQEVELDGDVLEYGPMILGQGVERIFLPTVQR